jgi:hypothetical protein
MARRIARDPDARSLEAIVDASDLRSVMSTALAARPVDEAALRRGVWTYVGNERQAGASPGRIIDALTSIIDEAKLETRAQHIALARRVTLWCVEAYFGHLGGAAIGQPPIGAADAPAPHPQ